MSSKPGVPPRRINVALQGGGSHGAFSWGVLDRLLEEESLEIEGLSGTSAGAMNAIVVAEGLLEGGRDKARAQLTEFWAAVSREAIFSPVQRTPFDALAANWPQAANPGLLWLDIAAQLVSPYQFNPWNINPLRSMLLATVDFDRVRACRHVRLFVTTTNVHTGRARVFSGPEVTIEAVLASACLPQLYQAVMIDGEPHWDGGYMGNPVLWPFFKHCESPDVLIVQINPIRRSATPMTPREITDRVNEISFNSSLIRELMHVEFINAALRRGDLAGQGYREVFLHQIDGGEVLRSFHASSKLNAEWPFLLRLRDLGREAADAWIGRSGKAISRRSTMNLEEFRLDRPPSQRGDR